MNAIEQWTEARQPARAVFLSDFHLGARGCRADKILSFLKNVEADRIYLVGDILDVFHGGRIFWNDLHSAVMRDLRIKARNGARVMYLPGNHDAPVRHGASEVPSEFEIREATVHTTGEGRRMLVMHGDQCDPRILRWHAMTRLGSRCDAVARGANDLLRAWRDLPEAHRTTLERAIARVNAALAMGERFERRVLDMVQQAGTDGVICGHSHQPALRQVGGLTFANCGDWMDSLTALLETPDGALKLIQMDGAQAPMPEPISKEVGEWQTAL